MLLFSVLFGLAALSLGKTVAPLVALLDQAGKTLFAIVGIIMRLAPIGAFGAMAFTVGRYGVGSLLSLGQLMAGDVHHLPAVRLRRARRASPAPSASASSRS